MATVEINQVGPIETLEIPVPADGGVCILRGRNGCGKTIALDTANRLLGGKARPQASDGADKGTAEGWGARLTVASRITRAGTLEAASLEGSFDLASLVDPGIEDPTSADGKRIKALLSLLGIQATESLFTPRLLPQEIYAQLGVDASEDLVEMAGRVKRKLEEGARTHAKSAENHRTKAGALVTDTEEIPSSVQRDSSVLQQTLEAAIQHRSQLEEKSASVLNRIEEQDQARAKVAELPPCDVLSAKQELSLAGGIALAAAKDLEEAERAAGDAQHRLDLAKQNLESQRLLHEHREAMDALLSESLVVVPASELSQVVVAVDEARFAMERGVKARQFDDRQAKAETERRLGKDAQFSADLFRDAAHGIDGVLSDAVEGLDLGLFVENGRLCVATSRGSTPFSELSHGERWKLALELGVTRVGARGVLAIPQEAWEGLDFDARALIDGQAKQLGVVVLTAQADFGDLRAETYGSEVPG